AFGSYRRMEMALGCRRVSKSEWKAAREKGMAVNPMPDSGWVQGKVHGGIEELAGRIGELVRPEPPRSLGEALARARQFTPLLKIGPKRVKRAMCQEVVKTGDEIDLTRLPMLRCWPLDGDLAAVGYQADVNTSIDGL